jgi:RNA polymerase sigma-70 factor (ECF subfamily)
VSTYSVPSPASDAAAAPPAALEDQLETHRRALTGYCYRMLGSWFEAEDAVQETMVRAWRGAEGLHSRPALRSWLYRIATNVCLDALQGTKRRARPMDLADPMTADSALDSGLPDQAWLQPAPDSRVLPAAGDPAEAAVARETIRLAFVAALQHLPPKQRVVLILRSVLQWRAAEVAELLDTTVASVNSALQRARATLDALDLDGAGPPQMDEAHAELLERYVDAFERYDVDALVALLHEDATFCMPPFQLWLRGPKEVAGWLRGTGAGCHGSRLVPTTVNGCPAFGAYRRSPDEDDVHVPFSLAVLEIAEGRIVGIHNFLDPELFRRIGLPMRLEGGTTRPLVPLPGPAAAH